jgi:CBS domain-containing protein
MRGALGSGRSAMTTATVQQLLHAKGHHLWSVTPDDTVYSAISLMAEKDVGALPVVEGDVLVGIITERHYARNIALKGRSSPQTLVRDIMEEALICTRPEQTIGRCMRLMTEHRVRHLPVVNDGKILGIVSIGDVVKSIIDDQKFVIEELEGYIYGHRANH